MQLDFSNNYFELFGLEPGFEIDLGALDARYQSLQRELHPDRFAGASDAERRWSMQASSLVNEAQRTLKSPLARARYLLSLNGVDAGMEEDTRMDGSFLMEQMEMREAVDEAIDAADPVGALDALHKQLQQRLGEMAHAFAAASAAADWDSARTRVREWQFFDALKRDVTTRSARLEDAG